MSTPVSSLPKTDTPASQTPIDSSVTDVLEEMEREVSAAQKSMPPPSQHSQHPQMAHQPSTGYMYQHMPSVPLYMNVNDDAWIDTPKVKTAVLATLMAMLLLVPKFPEIYDKFARIAFLAPYDLYLRAGLLAVLLYFMMVRLDL